MTIKYFLDPPALPSIDLRFERKTIGASGYDLMANIAMPRQIFPGSRWFCNTGLYLEIPHGMEAQVRTRSGLSRDHGIIVLNAPGTVDSDYRGEICVTLYNTDHSTTHTVLPGDRVAQLVFAPVFMANDRRLDCSSQILETAVRWGDFFQELLRVDNKSDLSNTDRGSSGHGSTGR